MTPLFLKIEEAEQLAEERADIVEALCKLTPHEVATHTLLDALIQATLAEESQWQEIEHRVDFQAHYQNREQARTDFLREYFSKPEVQIYAKR